jgi:hypothetical protein
MFEVVTSTKRSWYMNGVLYTSLSFKKARNLDYERVLLGLGGWSSIGGEDASSHAPLYFKSEVSTSTSVYTTHDLKA